MNIPTLASISGPLAARATARACVLAFSEVEREKSLVCFVNDGRYRYCCVGVIVTHCSKKTPISLKVRSLVTLVEFEY